jgi:uncharacterized membrane protein YccC
MARARTGKGRDMTTFAVTLLAQNSQTAPEEGVGLGLIVGTIVGVIIAIVVLWLIFTRVTKRSRGGVEPPAGGADRRRGEPPFESIERGR